MLRRINTNEYNKYLNHFLIIRDYKISIQGNENVSSIPRVNMKNPNNYEAYEMIVFYKEKPCIPMAYKEHFDNKGIARYINKYDVKRIINYIDSPICMTMEIECQ